MQLTVGPAMGRRQLAQLTEDHSDAEIDRAVAAIGVDAVMGQVLAAMAAAFSPEGAAGQSAVVQWDLTVGEGVRSWQLGVAEGRASVLEGSAAAPRVILALSLADFLRFAAGRLDGMQAFMSGRLRVSGDLMVAEALPRCFIG